MSVLPWLLTCALGAAPPGEWQVRYAQLQDQKPEWTAAGYTPSWELTWQDKAAPEVTWADTPAGDYRGWLLFGRPLELGDPAPAELRLALEYRTSCALNELKRSGQLYAFVMTRAAWETFAAKPEEAPIWRPPAGEDLLAWALVYPQGDDVEEWTSSGEVDLSVALRRAKGAELMVGLAWGAAHYTAEEHGGLRHIEVSMTSAEEVRWRFWQALDLDRPELAAVKQAVEARDEAAATAALAAYYREREGPHVANPVGPASDGTLAVADEVLGHTYRRLAGCPPYTFPGKIVWNADPFNYDQWAIALNRHGEWVTLAAAWLRTHDDKFAEEWADQVDDWVETMPVYIGPHWIEGPYNEPGRSALSLDAGIRLGQTWFPSFEVLRRSAAVSDATLVRFVRSCWDHARYLMRPENFRSGSNWGTMEANGLFHLGVLLPELRDAATWRDTAAQRMAGELEGQVYPDGAQQELSPGYHGVSLTNFLGVLRLAKANDVPLPAAYVQGLERMFEYHLEIALPDLRTPALNDSGRGGIQGYSRMGWELFPEREDFRWAATSRAEGQPPDYLSLAMPYAGWVIMRSGWDADAGYLLFDAGPFGTGHQHEDKLSIILYAYGHELLADAGNYAYDTSAWRRYVLSTRAHSTVRMDGQDQNCRADRGEYTATGPDTHGFRTDEHFDYARDVHTAGYGDPPDKSVVHRRRVLFVRPRYWLVIDDFAAADQREHAAEAQFLLNAPSAELEPQTLVVTGAAAGEQGARLAVVPLATDGLTVRIAQGETEPEVRGFLPEGFEQLRPAPAALYTRTFTGRAMVAYALVPFTGDSSPLTDMAVSRAGDRLTAALSFADGPVDRFEIGPTQLHAEASGATFEAQEEGL